MSQSLYHVTGTLRIEDIVKEGLIRGNRLLCTDVTCINNPELDPENLELMDDDLEATDAEKKLNEILNVFMPDRLRTAGVTRDAIYFWVDENQAEWARRENQKSMGLDLCIVEVDPEKIPNNHRCIIADSTITDEMFDLLGNEGVAQTYDYEQDEQTEKVDELAMKFWNTAEKYDKETLRAADRIMEQGFLIDSGSDQQMFGSGVYFHTNKGRAKEYGMQVLKATVELPKNECCELDNFDGISGLDHFLDEHPDEEPEDYYSLAETLRDEKLSAGCRLGYYKESDTTQVVIYDEDLLAELELELVE